LPLRIRGFRANSVRPRGPKTDALTLEQKTKISQVLTRQTPPLGNPTFPVAVGATLPADVQVHPLPSDAEQVAPKLRGLGYIVVEELVAIVDPRARKWRSYFRAGASPDDRFAYCNRYSHEILKAFSVCAGE